MAMNKLHIITPVKDSIELTIETARAIMDSKIDIPFVYTIYNDFSTPENTKILEEESQKMGFELINLSDFTNHPSPNYLLVLQMAQKKAIAENAALLIVESDVIVKPDTAQTLVNGIEILDRPGMIAAVTVDEKGEINFPYLYARSRKPGIYSEKKRLSFCCTLLTTDLLSAYDFNKLNPEKSWFDVTISHESLNEGYINYLYTSLPVWHRPHGSRPWKHLKYTNPLKYYWFKITKGLDKI